MERADPDLAAQPGRRLHDVAVRAPHDATAAWTGRSISPDLTRNDKRRQQYSGGEGITRDNTGVEVYGTIFAFEESPTTPGLLWAGSDDGLVHVSRDNGKNWKNVTPTDWPEGCINSIDLVDARSRPRDDRDVSLPPGRLHAVPLSRRTTTARRGGASPTARTAFPPTTSRASSAKIPARKGLLFAGTEFGLYASFDDGARWQSLQLNLPRTPVTDMKIYRDDLIVTTQGRGFWILDNLAPLRTPLPAAAARDRRDAVQAGGRVSGGRPACRRSTTGSATRRRRR